MTKGSSTSTASSIDWRFLLYNPRPKTSIVFGGGPLAQAIRMFSDRIIEPDSGTNLDVCDLAVSAEPNEKTLQLMFTSLKSGGDCYIEWNFNPYTKTKSIRERLEKAGFDMISLYMPKPDPSLAPPRLWIPIDSKAAINFLMDKACRSKTQSISLRLIFLIRLFLWRLSPGLFMSYPWLYGSGSTNIRICSLARKPAADSEPIRFQSIKEKLCILAGNHSTKGNTCRNCREIELLMFNSGPNVRNKIILAGFKKNSDKPFIIIKIARTEISDRGLANEAQNLTEIQNKYGFNHGIPYVIFANQDLGHYAVGESFIDGLSLDSILSVGNSRILAIRATSWLLDLANSTGMKPPIDWKDKLLEPLLQDLPVYFRDSLSEIYFEYIKQAFHKLAISVVVCEQRDFSPWNILLNHDGGIGILDWESSIMVGLPALDLIYFLTYFSFYIEGAWKSRNFVSCYRSMLDKNTFSGRIFSECTNLYATRLGLSPESLITLRIITWLTHIKSEINNSIKTGAVLNNESLQIHYSLLKEELLSLHNSKE